MSGPLVEVLNELKSLKEENARRDKVLEDLSKANRETGVAVNAVQKMFTGHGRAVVGFDGAVGGNVTLPMGYQTKQIGKEFGSFLMDVYRARMHHDVEAHGRIMKRYEGENFDHDPEGWGRVQKAYKADRSKALAEGTGSTGGYLVPPQYSNQLLRLAAEKSFLRDKCTVMPMTGRELHVPTYDQTITPTTGSSAVFAGVVGTWNPEGVTYSKTQPAWQQIELTARDLTMYTVVSNQLLDDNAFGLEALLTTLFRDAIGWFYDYYILRGGGVSQPLGILNAGATYSESRSGGSNTFTPDDAASMYSRLLTQGLPNSIWCMHPAVVQQLILFGTTVNTNVVGSWLPTGGGKSSIADEPPATLLGRPVFFTEKLPNLGTAGDVMFIDPTKIVVGDRMQIQIESSRDYLFASNQTAWRVIIRWDSQPWMDGLYILADGTFTQGVAVALAA